MGFYTEMKIYPEIQGGNKIGKLPIGGYNINNLHSEETQQKTSGLCTEVGIVVRKEIYVINFPGEQ